ncbi:Carboxypeptidase Cpds [Mycena chlorophos]|uniref:Carboxypeptidase n=1 Tax=Mycena chlorophos TaxID=658473 RepID=A0A8H6SHU8_MYCCL|nr:Carboxypeptidase Cpds [Mycena chlorophos]
MARLESLLVFLSSFLSFVWALGGAIPEMEEAMQIQREQLARFSSFLGPTAQSQSHTKRQSTMTFSNPAAEAFLVDGTTIPDVNFDAGPSWAGLLPISGDPDETRKLFFWFWPTTNASNTKDLIFWTNGGPGCSSLEGFLQENGPISWSWGQAEPTPNPFAWNQLAHMIWVEQPVGTGFSQGTPNITNDDELAAQLVGFFGQFLEIFHELKGNDLWLTGESYAGFYVPRIANFIYENPDLLDLSLQGIYIADPSLTYGVVQEDIPALRFANQNVFPFNSSFMAQLQAASDACGYTDYLDQFITYPPAGPIPFPVGVPEGSTSASAQCRLSLNPVFNIYRVTDTFPNLWSVLGFPRSTQEFIYFNRTDVQDAIHAPHINWEICASKSVYAAGGDKSVASMLTAAGANISTLGNVIEKSVRTVVAHGLADMILIAEGTRIAIQNMTWGGLQGFQTPIEPESFVVDSPVAGVQGVYGNTHTERGLTYIEFYYSGHMTPQFVPWAAFSAISFLLGKQDSPSSG